MSMKWHGHPAHEFPVERPAHGLPAERPAHGLPAERPAHEFPAERPAHGLPAERPAHEFPVERPAHGFPAIHGHPAHEFPAIHGRPAHEFPAIHGRPAHEFPAIHGRPARATRTATRFPITAQGQRSATLGKGVFLLANPEGVPCLMQPFQGWDLQGGVFSPGWRFADPGLCSETPSAFSYCSHPDSQVSRKTLPRGIMTHIGKQENER